MLLNHFLHFPSSVKQQLTQLSDDATLIKNKMMHF